MQKVTNGGRMWISSSIMIANIRVTILPSSMGHVSSWLSTFPITYSSNLDIFYFYFYFTPKPIQTILVAREHSPDPPAFDSYLWVLSYIQSCLPHYLPKKFQLFFFLNQSVLFLSIKTSSLLYALCPQYFPHPSVESHFCWLLVPLHV